jgi:hypothetical protein
VLVDLAPYLAGSLLNNALTATQAITEATCRITALVALAQRLPDSDNDAAIHRALAEIRAERAKTHPARERKAKILLELAPHLQKSEGRKCLLQALAEIKSITNEHFREPALCRLALDLVAKGHPEEGLIAINSIKLYQLSRAAALAELAPHLAEPRRTTALRDALEASRKIRDAGTRAAAVAGIALRLPEPEQADTLREALGICQAMPSKQKRHLTLARLAPHLPAPLLLEVLASERPIGDGRHRASVLARLAVTMAEPDRSVVLDDAVVVAEAIQEAMERIEALGDVVPYLLQDSRSAVLRDVFVNVSLVSEEDFGETEIPSQFATQMSDAALRQSPLWPTSRSFDRYKAKVLAAVAPHLPAALLGEALALVRNMSTERYRAAAYPLLTPYLQPRERQVALRRVLRLARRLPTEERSETLMAVAGQLTPPLLKKAFALARKIENEACRIETLAALAPHLPEVKYLR